MNRVPLTHERIFRDEEFAESYARRHQKMVEELGHECAEKLSSRGSRNGKILDVDGAVRELMDGMAEIMYTYEGIGLAAPQVGMLQRIVIADIGEGLLTLANPEILQKEGEDRLEEGCLSLPDIQVDIARSQSIFVHGINPEGKETQHELSGPIARVIQHEIDHLNGVLIIDHASPTEKIFLRKELKKLQRQYKT